MSPRLSGSLLLLSLLSAPLTIVQCGGGSSSPTTPTSAAAVTVRSLSISGTASFTSLSQTVQLAAMATMSDGSSRDVTSTAVWQSTNAGVVSVSASGLVTSVGAGSCEVTATHQGARATTSASVAVRTCTYVLSETRVTFERDGGNRSVTVQSSDGGCSWQAVSNASWVLVTGGTSGTGNGTVSYRVEPHPGGASRQATIPVGNQSLSITQTADAPTSSCRYCVSSTEQIVPRAGGSYSFSVRPTASDTQWTAVSNQPWIRIVSGSSGTGSGTVRYTVDANGFSSERSGTISVGGLSGLFERELHVVVQRP